MTARQKRVPLGQLLLSLGVLGEEQLARALERQRMQSGRLGSHLLDLGFVAEKDLSAALSAQSGLPPFAVAIAEVDSSLSAKLPRAIAKKHNVCPVGWEEKRGELTLAVTDPMRLDILDDLRFAVGAKRVEQRIAPVRSVERLLDKVYDGIEPPGEVSTDEASLAPSGFQASTGAGDAKPREKARKKGRVVLADADRKRARALAALLEFSGYEVAKATGTDEVARMLQGGGSLWAHRDFPGSEGFLTALLYDDPAETFGDSLENGAALAAEACSLARLAAEGRGVETASAGNEAVGLMRFLGARRGLGQSALARLEIKTWRATLENFTLPSYSEEYPGRELLVAASVYFRALAAGASRQEAARAVREDATLEAEASTLLLRWSLGADLVGRLDGAGRVLLISKGGEAAGPIGDHLARSGWEVVRGAEWEEGQWDAVLAMLAPGLNLLETWSHSGPERRPPVFLFAEVASGPDTMYAIRLGAEDVFEPGVQAEVVEAKMNRAVRRAGTDGQKALSGDLREMGFADLMQVLSNGARTCLLKISSPLGEGTVALKDGLVIDARTPGKVGVAAFYEQVGWTEGRFEILSETGKVDATIQGESTEGLLMEGFRLLDESRR